MKKIGANLLKIITRMELESQALHDLIHCIQENESKYLDSDQAFRNLIQALRKTTINNQNLSNYRSEIGSLKNHIMTSMLFDSIL